jgi:hypothetical protein
VTADDDVIAGSTIDRVVSLRGGKRVVAVSALECVVAEKAF